MIPGRGKTVPLRVGGETVFGTQGTGAGNVIIRGLDTYPEITEKLARQGLTGPALSRSMIETLRTGKGPRDIKRLVALTFGTETARSLSSTVLSPLTFIGMEQGSLTTPGAFGAPGTERPLGGGLYPPSQRGFVAAEARSLKRLGGEEFREGTKIHTASEENMNRTVQLVTMVTQEMYFKDMDHFRTKVTELLELFGRRIGG
jgi:hypothetical protein